MKLLYGTGTVDVQLPEDRCDVIAYKEQSGCGADIIERALNHPIGTPRLEILAQNKKNAVILISDSSRLCPSYLFLEQLLDRLNKAGIPDHEITIIAALGMHRKLTREELIALTSERAFRRAAAVVNHSALSEDCDFVGTTSRGTPVEINRTALHADLLIATGNIEPHRLVGMSGGVKALVPGVASARCIEQHHSLSRSFNVQPGHAANPLHVDLEEAARMVGVHFMLNVIANHRREILDAVSGCVFAAHREGIAAANARFMVPIGRKYDTVIVSPGGSPKDSQLYQAVKTLQNAADAAKPGGSIICAAQCGEIFGNGMLQHWIETIQDPEAMRRKLNERFVLGAHKTEHIQQIVQQYNVRLYSDIPKPIVSLAGFEPIEDLQACIDAEFADATRSIAVMPYGAITFPQTL